MSVPRLAGVHHLKLPVRDLDRSQRWYESRLGYEKHVEFAENGVDHHPDPTYRMIDRDQILGAQRRQHRQLRIRSSAHTEILVDPTDKREHLPPSFSAPC